MNSGYAPGVVSVNGASATVRYPATDSLEGVSHKSGDGRTAWIPAPWLLVLWGVTRFGLLAGLDYLGDSGDGVMPLISNWARQIANGRSPYGEEGVAYPPLAMLFFAFIGLGEELAGRYAVRFAGAVLCADLLGLCVASRAERLGRRFAASAYLLGTVTLGPILFLWRYDLLPAVFHLAAAFFVLRGARGLSWSMLGAGIALKPYLAVVVPLWAVWELKSEAPSRGRRLAGGMFFASMPSIVSAVAMFPISGASIFSAYIFQVSRGVQIESGPAVVLAELSRTGLLSQGPVFSRACLCWERAGEAATLAAGISSLLTAAGLVTLFVLVWRRPDVEHAVSASCSAVLILLLTYRVFSPQYLVWALAPMALLAPGRAGRLALSATGTAALIATYLYPLHYHEVINHTGAGRWLMLARTVILSIALALLTRSGAREGPTAATRGDPGVDAFRARP